MAQRSAEGRAECAAEQAGDLHDTSEDFEMFFRGVRLPGLYLPSQRMHSKGEQGNQTMSLPVSMYTETVSELRVKLRV